MIRALYSAASGMTAQQRNVDNSARNLANAPDGDDDSVILDSAFLFSFDRR